MPDYTRRVVNIRGRTRVPGRAVNFGASIRAAIEYTRAATDTVKVKLDSARKGLPGDTLTLTALTLDGTDATGNVAEALISPELADTEAPGALTGASGQKVTGMSSVSSGVLYLISYEVTAADVGVTLFYPSAGPFGTGNLPTSLGIHNVLVTAEDGDTGNAINKGGTGDITISAMSIKRAEWNYTATGASAGDVVAFTITRGEVTTSRSVTVPVSDEFYVHGTGSDTTGTGSVASPYRTPQFALDQGVGAGDTLFMGAGVYDPFNIEASGTSGNPITITAIPGQEYEGVIRGELQSHVAQGGSVESTLPESKRDGVYIDSQDWIIVEKLTIEWVWRTGIFVVGTASEQHGHIIIRDNVIRDVGRSAVYVGGNNSSSVIPSGETSSLRTVDVLIEDNDITRTNLQIDNDDFINQTGNLGFGNVEAISAAASASSIVAKGNSVYDTRQYGIDFKAGVNGSYTPVSGDVNFAYGPGNFIEENTITNTERHGIYIDAGQRFCEDITIRNNTVTGCRHGIVLARENGAGSNAFLSLDSIDIFNNVIVDSDQIGIYYHNHPGDTDTGTISNIRTRFNTVVNSNREGGFKDLNLDDWSENFSTATMTGNDFSGNLVYSDQEMDMAVNLTGGWSRAENFNVVDGTSTGTNPNFVGADNGNYILRSGSAASGVVTTASLAADPFDKTKGGSSRVQPFDAGANSTSVGTLAFNADQFRDYSPGIIFTNVAKQMREWTRADGALLEASYKDDNNYPKEIPGDETEIVSYWAWSDAPSSVQGTYTLEYTGDCVFDISGSGTIVSRTDTGSGEEITFNVTGNGDVVFTITSIPDALDNPRDFVILRDDVDWVARYNAGHEFSADFVTMIMPNSEPLAEYRHLNSMTVNDSLVVDWSDYPSVNNATYTTGVPVRSLCNLANEAGHAPWFCIPAQASDAFVTAMAAEVKTYLHPGLLARTKIEYTNEAWNIGFDQNSYCLYQSCKDWGTAYAGISITQGATTFTVSDATGLVVGKPFAFGDDTTRVYLQPKITGISGTTITVDRDIDLPTGTYTGYYGDFWAAEWYTKRATEVITAWEAETGYPCRRVLGTHTSTASTTRKQLDSAIWASEEPGSFVDPTTFFDDVAVTTYLYAAFSSEERDDLLAEFDASYETGRDYALNLLLNDSGKGLHLLDTWLTAQRDELDGTDLNLIVYEGMSDHTIAGLTDSADDTRLWQNYETLVYSDAYDPVVEGLHLMTKRHIDGPAMKYKDMTTPGKSGLWGLYRELGETNEHANKVLALADGEKPWWLPNYAPHVTDALPATIERTTSDSETVDVSPWFSRNAITFTASNLPDGITLSGSVLSFAPTTTEDLVQAAQITAASVSGASVTAAFDIDLEYIAGPPAAMSVDTDALLWIAPDSVTASGGVVTSITDKTGNGYDFDAIPTGLAGPAFDGSKMTFDGSTTAIRTTGTGPFATELYTNTGEVVLIAVLQPNPETDSPVIAAETAFLAENMDTGSNRAFSFGAQVGLSAQVRFLAKGRRFSDAYELNPLGQSFAAPSIYRATITQSTATLHINGVLQATDSVTTANFPQSANKLTLGGYATDAGSLGRQYWGDTYEVFASADASGSNIDAVEAELAFKYGITI